MDKAINNTARPKACPGAWMSEDYNPGTVSVIVPAYNRADLIEETLESVRAQTYRPIEIIVVDDGSTDNTAQAVGEFAERAKGDLEVRYFRQENQGAPAARNHGLLESRGEFIQFLDSDDLLRPDKLSAQVDALRREPEVQYVFSAWERFPKDGPGTPHWWRKSFNPDRRNLLDLLLGADRHQLLPLHTANGLYRRSLCARIGPWDAEQRCLQPRLYNLHVLLLDVPYRYLPAVHLSVRQHPGEQISDHYADSGYLADSHRTYEEMRRLLEDAGLLGRRQRLLLGRVYYHLARPALIAGATRLGTELLDEAVSIAPASATRLKLQFTRLLYRMVGTAGANRLFDIKMRFAAALRRTAGSTGSRREHTQGRSDELDDCGS